MGKKIRIPRGYYGGNKSRSPYQYIRWAKGQIQGRTPPRPDVAEDKMNDRLLRLTFWVIPWNSISTKMEKDNEKNENI